MEKDNNSQFKNINTLSRKFFSRIRKEWVDASKACPLPYELVTVETDTKKIIPAWWDKENWNGPRLKENDHVIRWRKRRYEHIHT